MEFSESEQRKKIMKNPDFDKNFLKPHSNQKRKTAKNFTKLYKILKNIKKNVGISDKVDINLMGFYVLRVSNV